jgi:hypothetical protein
VIYFGYYISSSTESLFLLDNYGRKENAKHRVSHTSEKINKVIPESFIRYNRKNIELPERQHFAVKHCYEINNLL